MNERFAEVNTTGREQEVWKNFAHGYSPDEIGDIVYPTITRETVRKTIANLKIKLHLQKAQELAAHYWCRISGTTLEEQRQMLAKTANKAVSITQKSFNTLILIGISTGLYISTTYDHSQILRSSRQRVVEYRIRRN